MTLEKCQNHRAKTIMEELNRIDQQLAQFTVNIRQEGRIRIDKISEELAVCYGGKSKRETTDSTSRAINQIETSQEISRTESNSSSQSKTENTIKSSLKQSNEFQNGQHDNVRENQDRFWGTRRVRFSGISSSPQYLYPDHCRPQLHRIDF
jgi:hypothetical protein